VAIKQVVTGGVGFCGGQIGFLITRGFGALTGGGGSGPTAGAGVIGVVGRFLRLGRRRGWF